MSQEPWRLRVEWCVSREPELLDGIRDAGSAAGIGPGVTYGQDGKHHDSNSGVI